MQWMARFSFLAKCIFSIVILFNFAHAYAEGPGHTYQGSYVGFAVGPGIITGNFGTNDISADYLDKTDATVPHTLTYKHPVDDDAYGAAGRISMGYGGCLFVNCFYMGGEISAFQMTENTVTEEFIDSEIITDANGGNNQITLKNKATASLGMGFAADLKVGMLLSEEFLLYGLGGIIISEVKLKSEISLEPNTSNIEGTASDAETEKHTRAGFHVGLGVEQKITQRMGLILAYTYANYGRLETSQSVVTYTDNVYGTGHLEADNQVTITQQEAWLGINYYF